ncbi:hypothetical protein FQR65_LT20685 [Abscondita terminalis]|nr:hypothetical protein FQR65_LT20685 [Abscondita terminalis]
MPVRGHAAPTTMIRGLGGLPPTRPQRPPSGRSARPAALTLATAYVAHCRLSKCEDRWHQTGPRGCRRDSTAGHAAVAAVFRRTSVLGIEGGGEGLRLFDSHRPAIQRRPSPASDKLHAISARLRWRAVRGQTRSTPAITNALGQYLALGLRCPRVEAARVQLRDSAPTPDTCWNTRPQTTAVSTSAPAAEYGLYASALGRPATGCAIAQGQHAPPIGEPGIANRASRRTCARGPAGNAGVPSSSCSFSTAHIVDGRAASAFAAGLTRLSPRAA